MRYFLLLTGLWLLVSTARAAGLPAHTAALRIERLPAAGLLLSKGWRYHTGDNPAWASPGFDDRTWDTLNPARPRHELPPALSTGISWLRLRFRLGDSLPQQALLLQVRPLGACEVYLNGQLVLRQGAPAADPTQARPSPYPSAPVGLRNTSGDQLLAVRVSAWQRPPLRTTDQLPLVGIALLTAPQLWAQAVEEAGGGGSIYYIIAGVFGVLTLIRLAFFAIRPLSGPTCILRSTRCAWRWAR